MMMSSFKNVAVVTLIIGLTHSIRARVPSRFIMNDETAVIGYEGETLQLACRAPGVPFPITTWFKNGERILKNWKRYTTDGANLIISNLQKSDDGTYLCEAINGFGKKHFNVQVTVKGNCFSARHGDSHLICMGKSWRVRWFRVKFFVCNCPCQQLKLVDDTKKHKRKRRNHKLVRKPVFSQPVKMRRHNILETYGGTVRLRCKAKGRPKPQIEWFKDGNLTTVGLNVTKSQWTLTLVNVTPQNTGKYTCRVWNVAGEITSMYNVQVSGRIRDSPVLLEPHPVNTTVHVGERTSIQCLVRSPAPPTIKWIKRLDNHAANLPKRWKDRPLVIEEKSYLILPEQEMMQLKDGTYLNKFLIKRATMRDAGMYICFGANSMGYNFRYAYLTVLANGNVPSASPANSLRKFHSESWFSLPVIIGVPAGIGLSVVFAITVYCFFKHKRIGIFNSFAQKHDMGNNLSETPISTSCMMSHRLSFNNVIKEGCAEFRSHEQIHEAVMESVNAERCSSLVKVSTTGEKNLTTRPLLSTPSPTTYVEMTVKRKKQPVDFESGLVLSRSVRSPPPPPPPSQYSIPSSSHGNRHKHNHSHRVSQCHHHRACSISKHHRFRQER